MPISLHRTLRFDNLFDLTFDKKQFQLVLQNDTNETLCDLHFLTLNSLASPPKFVAIKIQTTFDANQMILPMPSPSLDIDFKTFFNSERCIPFGFPGSFFIVTLTFDRNLLPEDSLLVEPTNSLGIVVIS